MLKGGETGFGVLLQEGGSMDPVTGLIIVGGIVLAMFAIAFIWELGRSAYFWTAAKIMGWSEHEKFMRETAWLERQAARNKRIAERDKRTDTAERRRMGSYLVAWVIAWVAYRTQMPWYQMVAVLFATAWGLHMVGGVTLKWSG